MTDSIFKALSAYLFAVAAVAVSAAPAIDVLVSDATGKVAYKGQTSGNNTFATPKLKQGNYVVQFNSQNIKGDHAIVISAGQKKVRAESVSASKFRAGGVALKIEVGAGLNLTGQVAAVATGMVSDSNPKAKDASMEAARGVQDRSGLGAVNVPGRPR